MALTINSIIKEYIKAKSINEAELARKIGLIPQNFNRKLKEHDMDVSLVVKLCKELQHDFFNELSKQLPANIRNIKGNYTESKIELAIKELIENSYPKIKK